MRHLLLLLTLIPATFSLMAGEKDDVAADNTYRELHFPLTEADTKTDFYYFNDQWIPDATPNMLSPDSIISVNVRQDEYGNRTLYFTVSQASLDLVQAKAKEAVKDLWINRDPICQFPGGNGKLRDWINENINIPDSFKGNAKVIAGFKVLPDGSVSDIKILRGSDNEDVNAEAVRLVNALPKFRVKYFTPVKHPINYCVAINFTSPGTIVIR